MGEPKRDNLLLMPKNRRNELSAALRDLLGAEKGKRRQERRVPSRNTAVADPIYTSVIKEFDNNESDNRELDSVGLDHIEDRLVIDDSEFREVGMVDSISLYSDVDSVNSDTKEKEISEVLNDEVLDAVAPDDVISGNPTKIQFIKVSAISASPYQTRDMASDAEIEILSQSIVARGVIQPIIVRASGLGSFELVAGERRLRAAIHAGFSEIPAIVRDLNDRESAEISIIENAQRENLNPIEEALAFKTIHEQFNIAQREIAQLVGKSRVFVTNSLRLLQLHPEVIECIKTGELSAGHGRALLMVVDEKIQRRLASKAIGQQLSVRTLEHLVSQINNSIQEQEIDEEKEQLNASLNRAKIKVQNFLDMELVSLSQDNKGRRRLQLTFETEAQWRKFLGKIK